MSEQIKNVWYLSYNSGSAGDVAMTEHGVFLDHKSAACYLAERIEQGTITQEDGVRIKNTHVNEL